MASFMEKFKLLFAMFDGDILCLFSILFQMFYVGVGWVFFFLCVWDVGAVSLFLSILSKDFN